MTLMEKLTNATVDEDNNRGNVPEWVKLVVIYVVRSMWAVHDGIWSKVWGRGDGRGESEDLNKMGAREDWNVKDSKRANEMLILDM